MRSELGSHGRVADVSRRDAFHVPAILVTCYETIQAGLCLKFTDDSLTVVEPCLRFEMQAIADPFLRGSVINKGTAFWALIPPELTNGLRHHFHLDFEVREGEEDEEDEREYEPDPCDRCES